MSERNAAWRLLSERHDVSRETFGRLEVVVEQVSRWTQRINLVSRRSLDALWSRHVLDSLGLIGELSEARRWVDVGSGGGFPVVPLAIVASGRGLETTFVAVESDQRKAVFLTELARRVDVELTVHSDRLEHLEPLEADVISSRAFASVVETLDLCSRHLSADGRMVFMKGDRLDDELTEAARSWHMVYATQQNPVTQQGRLLRVVDFVRT